MLSCNNISKKLAKRLGMFALGSAAVCLLITNDNNEKSNVIKK